MSLSAPRFGGGRSWGQSPIGTGSDTCWVGNARALFLAVTPAFLSFHPLKFFSGFDPKGRQTHSTITTDKIFV